MRAVNPMEQFYKDIAGWLWLALIAVGIYLARLLLGLVYTGLKEDIHALKRCQEDQAKDIKEIKDLVIKYLSKHYEPRK
jgi:hypothetical protein